MLDLSKPDTARTPAQQQTADRQLKLVFLAFWAAILSFVKGPDWLEWLQLKAAAAQLHPVALVLFWLLSLLPLYFLHVLIHEGGHALGARLTGFRIIVFMAGRLRIDRRPSGWQLRWQKPQVKLGGMVQVFTPYFTNLRSRYMLLVAAGPLATLLSGAAALVLHGYLWPWAGPASYALAHALWLLGWLSILSGVLNLLPLKNQARYSNDGTQLLRLLRQDATAHQHLLVLRLSGSSYSGQRPRDWDQALVDELLAQPGDGTLDALAHYYAYCYFHDRNDLPRLQYHLHAALDQRHLSPISFQQHALAEAAYVAALHLHDAAQARQWLDLAQETKPFTDEEGLFASAAVAWAEGRPEPARHWLAATRRQLADSIDLGGTEQALERLDAFEAQLHLTIDQVRAARPADAQPDEQAVAVVGAVAVAGT